MWRAMACLSCQVSLETYFLSSLLPHWPAHAILKWLFVLKSSTAQYKNKKIFKSVRIAYLSECSGMHMYLSRLGARDSHSFYFWVRLTWWRDSKLWNGIFDIFRIPAEKQPTICVLRKSCSRDTFCVKFINFVIRLFILTLLLAPKISFRRWNEENIAVLGRQRPPWFRRRLSAGGAKPESNNRWKSDLGHVGGWVGMYGIWNYLANQGT